MSNAKLSGITRPCRSRAANSVSTAPLMVRAIAIRCSGWSLDGAVSAIRTAIVIAATAHTTGIDHHRNVAAPLEVLTPSACRSDDGLPAFLLIPVGHSNAACEAALGADHPFGHGECLLPLTSGDLECQE